MIKQRRQERELREAFEHIDKRAQKRDKQIRESFATSDISPFNSNSFYIRHSKALTYCALECFHATFFHFIDTVKVRGMARNLTEDVSFYFRNQVQYKRKSKTFVILKHIRIVFFFSYDIRSGKRFLRSRSRKHDVHHHFQCVDLLFRVEQEIF